MTDRATSGPLRLEGGILRFRRPLVPGVLVRRYDRFLADVRFPDGRVRTVHCAATGSMEGCAEPDHPVWTSDSENPDRKYGFSLEMVRARSSWVGVNTALPNRAVELLCRFGRVPELVGYDRVRREAPLGEGRVDLLLGDRSGSRLDCLVEIKQVTLSIDGRAAFPDAPTRRGRDQLVALRRARREGRRVVVFFFVARDDCTGFRPAREVDPAYADALEEAREDGVEVIARAHRYGPDGIEPVGRLPPVP